MRKSTGFVLSLPLLCAGLTFAFRGAGDRWVGGMPLLVCPDSIDLGERDQGEIATGRFRIKNGGGGELLVNEFRTSCSCAGVERFADDRLVTVESVRLGAGQEVELMVRVAVGVRPGESQVVHVLFDTNDPSRRRGHIEVIVPLVKGGAYAVPTAVAFGTLPAGEPARQVLNLYNMRMPGRVVARVRSTRPEQFEARLVPLQPGEERVVHETAGELIARAEIIARTERKGEINGDVEVQLLNEDRQPDRIPVTGRVSPEVECWPGVLVFPRRLGKRSLYAADVAVRSRDGKQVRLEIESLPDGVSAGVQPVIGSEDQVLLHVSCTHEALSKHRREAGLWLRLNARTGQVSQPLQLPIRFVGDSS